MIRTVCILAAGQGKRMGRFAGVIHKSLLPVQEKAALSWIVDSFEKEKSTRFVIAIGNSGSQIKDYVALAHPNSKVQFVEVDESKEGSGPGKSVLECEPYLKNPFYICCCDTIWLEPFKEPIQKNWIGVGKVPAAQIESYCNIQFAGSKVVRFYDKENPDGDQVSSFTGLAFIQDTNIFFEGLRNGTLIRNELQLSSGFQALMDHSELETVSLETWRDIGTEERYLNVAQDLGESAFSKSGEFFYRAGDTVIKFHSSKEIARNKIEKSQLRPKLFPKVAERWNHFYAYCYIPGKTLYEYCPEPVFKKFLNFMIDDVWLSNISRAPSQNLALDFYKEETRQRVSSFEKKYILEADIAKVNGQKVQPVKALFDAIAWDEIADCRWGFIHGDLQLDNVIYDEQGFFKLIDWRHDFSGRIDVGDIYYDLGKLLMSLQINLRHLKQGHFQILKEDQEFNYKISIPNQNEIHIGVFEDFCKKNHFSFQKIKIIAALALLRMSGLHEKNLAQIFYHTGRLWLSDMLKK